MKIPIRCCCRPSVVLGFVDVLRTPLRGEGYTWPTIDGRITLHAQLARDPDTRRVRLAFKSDDMPLGVLRAIPGFVEVNRPIRIGDENDAGY